MGEPKPVRELPDGSWAWFADTCRAIGKVFNPVVYRIRVHRESNIPASGPLVLVCNHSAMIDGVVLFNLLHRRSTFLIKAEMFKGFMSWYLPRIGQLSIRRGEADRATLMAAVKVLKDGGLIGVFPEGTRGAGEVETAQQGAAWIARMGGAQVLPVACRGTKRPAGSGWRFRPKVDVLVGSPIPPPTGKGKAGLVEYTELLRKQLVELIAELDEIRGAR